MRIGLSGCLRQAFDQAALLEIARKITGWAVGHDEVNMGLGLETVDELGNMFVVDPLEKSDFALKIVQELRGQLVSRDCFDRHGGAGHGALNSQAFVHRSKGPATDLLLDFKRPNSVVRAAAATS